MPLNYGSPPKYALAYGLILSLVAVLVTNFSGDRAKVVVPPSQEAPASRPVANNNRPVSLPTPMPAVTPMTTPEPRPSPEIHPTSQPPPTVVPSATPAPESKEELSLSLTLLSPSEGAGVEIGAIRVLGLTRPGAEVKVNQAPVSVAPDGTFQVDLLLEEGVNTVTATAQDPEGRSASRTVPVLFIPSTTGVPLSVFYPNGLEVTEPQITVLGATRQDAVVGVNGVPVAVNSLGIFSATVPLEEGANLVEVVAVDIDGSVNFQTVVVFYLPDSFRDSYTSAN